MRPRSNPTCRPVRVSYYPQSNAPNNYVTLRSIRLPADKQFLITRNVACHRRCKQMEYVGEETIVETGDGDDDGWVETHHYGSDGANLTELEENVCDMTLDSEKVSCDLRLCVTIIYMSESGVCS